MVIWIVLKSGPTCTMTSLPHCLGIWQVKLTSCENYWACERVPMFLIYMMKRGILSKTFVSIESLHFFITHYHTRFFIFSLDLKYYVFRFTSIRYQVFLSFAFFTYTWLFLLYLLTVPYLLVNSVRRKLHINKASWITMGLLEYTDEEDVTYSTHLISMSYIMWFCDEPWPRVAVRSRPLTPRTIYLAGEHTDVTSTSKSRHWGLGNRSTGELQVVRFITRSNVT